MANIKFANILGGMNWDIPAHAHTQNLWAQLKNARTWVKAIENVGGWVNEFNYTMGISQPNMVQFWDSLNSSGTKQGYFVYANAGNIRRISPAGDADIRGLNPTYRSTLVVSTIVSSTQIRGVGIGTAFPVGTYLSANAGLTPVQVGAVIDANNITVNSTAQWQPTAVLLAPVVTSVNSATVLQGPGLGLAVEVGNNLSSTATGATAAVTGIINANSIAVTSTAQWGSTASVTNSAVYAWTLANLPTLFSWALADYKNIHTGAVIANSSEWNFTAQNGGYNMVVSNPDIVPQYMSGDATQLSPLPGFIYGSINNSQVIATTCQVVRSFRNKLIAANFTHTLQNGMLIQRPSTVRISDNSAPGGIPQTWQPTAQNAADEFELNTTDPIQDIIVFKNYAIVLTTNSTWLIGDSTAGTATPVTPVNNIRGTIGKGASQVVDGWLYIVTTDDIVRTDGTPNNWQSIANDIVKSYFFEEELNITGQQSLFMRYHRYFNELFIAYPSKLSTGACDRALIFGLDDNAWSWTELPGIYDATLGPVVGNADALRPWPVNTYNRNVSRLHFASGNQLQAFDIGFTRSAPYTLDLQKYFDFGEVQGLDASQIKSILHIYPKFVSVNVATNLPASSQVTFQALYFNTPIQAPPFLDWTNPDWSGTFDVGGANPDFHLVPSARTRYMALRIISVTSNRLQLTGFEFSMKPTNMDTLG